METRRQIWKLVKLFTKFENHFLLFIAVNLILWIIALISGVKDLNSWPMYITLSWLAVLVIHCLVTYFKFQKNQEKI